MKKILLFSALALVLGVSSANADTIGVVDFNRIVDNYSKVKSLSDEISDKYSEIQRYTLDKEREYKKLNSPIERKNFEEATARELQKKQEAYIKLKERKEAEVDVAIKNAVKQAAIENKIGIVVEKSVVFFGGVDITDKVLKNLNSPTAAK